MPENGFSKSEDHNEGQLRQGEGLVGWLKSGSPKDRFVKTACFAATLLLGILVTSALCGFFMIMLPKFCAGLILSCLITAILIMLLTPLLLLAQYIAQSPACRKINIISSLVGFISGFILIIMGAGLFSFDNLVMRKVSAGLGLNLKNTEFPLGNPGGLAIDSRGRIYLGLQAYGRVQLYSGEGRFIRGFLVPTDGVINIWVDENDALHADLSRVYQIFDSGGRLLRSERIVLADHGIRLSRKAPGTMQSDTSGNTYELRDREWFPKVVKTTSDGREELVIQNPIHLWIMGSPQPALTVAAVGMLVVAISYIVAKKAKLAFCSTT